MTRQITAAWETSQQARRTELFRNFKKDSSGDFNVYKCTILKELDQRKLGNAHYCINERLNFLLSYRLSSGKMATLYVKDVQFVDANFWFYIF